MDIVKAKVDVVSVKVRGQTEFIRTGIIQASMFSQIAQQYVGVATMNPVELSVVRFARPVIDYTEVNEYFSEADLRFASLLEVLSLATEYVFDRSSNLVSFSDPQKYYMTCVWWVDDDLRAGYIPIMRDQWSSEVNMFVGAKKP